MIVLARGDVVLPDRVLSEGTIVIDAGRIAAIEAGAVDSVRATTIDASDCYVVPGFIDVHVHGIEGYDTLDGGEAVAEIGLRLPRYGVTAFCPTTVACPPQELRIFLNQVRDSRVAAIPGRARVLPAHLESNFISPDFRGAQPASCLRAPGASTSEGDFSTRDILETIAASDGWLDKGHGLDLTMLATAADFETRTNGATHMGNDDAIVFVKGRVDKRDDQPKLIAMEISRPEINIDGATTLTLRVRAPVLTETRVEKLRELLRSHPGESPVFVRVVGPEKETVLRLGDEFRCDTRNGLYAELRVLFGADCIA